MAGPLFINQRLSQRDTIQLLDVEEYEELQSVKSHLEKQNKGFMSMCSFLLREQGSISINPYLRKNTAMHEQHIPKESSMIQTVRL